jgi:undecaprenyl-diphosphatase
MLSSLDLTLSQSLANLIPHSPIFNFIFNTLSFTGSSVGLWIIIVMGVVVWEILTRSNKRAFTSQFIKMFLTASIALTFTLISVTYIIKPIVGRDRPYQVLHIQTKCPKDSSFPSGHAAAAAAGAFILAKFDHDKRRRVGYILIAIGISYSRIYLFCHYVGDVIAGNVYGLIIAVLTFSVVHTLYHRIKFK